MSRRKLQQKIRKWRYEVRSGMSVVEVDGVLRREYDDYQTYVRHQAAKYEVLRDQTPNERMIEVIADRLSIYRIEPGKSVLCLGARGGGECEGFARAGHFPVGVDLNPGRSNRWVVAGDFHNLQFGDDTVELVFSNALDHALDLDKVLSEVGRVLKPDGYFLLDAVLGHQDRPGFNPMSEYESYMWSRVSELAKECENRGFELIDRSPFEHPWPGESLLLQYRRADDPR